MKRFQIPRTARCCGGSPSLSWAWP